MKKLVLCFLVFLAVLYGLERTDFLVIATGLGALMAAMVFFHILASPDSKGPGQGNSAQG